MTAFPLPHVYTCDSPIRCSAIFTDPFNSGVDLDPTNVYFSYRVPSGISTTLTFGVSLLVVRDSAGHYHSDLLLNQAGMWYYSFWSDGAVGGVVMEKRILVKARWVASP